MSIAQAHSDYQASTGTVTNTGPTTAPNDPFVVSTPREDGAIIHVVRYGQSLIGIADAYDVALNDILQLNNFTLDTVIFPNEQIIVQVGNTPTASLSPTATRPTSTASVTATKSTPTPRGTFTQNPTSSLTPSGTPAPIPRGRERLVIGAVVMASIILVAVITSGLLAGRSKDSETE
jgi:LysM repeat protein